MAAIEPARRERPLREDEAAVVVECIRSMYEQGVPFFNKRSLQDIVAQLDHCRANFPPVAGVREKDLDPNHEWPVVSLTAIDGAVVKTPAKTGLVYPGPRGKGTEFVLYVFHCDTCRCLTDIDSKRMSPRVQYRAFQHLCDMERLMEGSPEKALCSTRLEYTRRERHIRTGELVNDFEHAAPEEVQKAFEDGVRQWEASPDCARFRGLFTGALLHRVDNIVAFACGSMTTWGISSRIVGQHAMT